jgi:hypothetical protein
MGDKNHKIIVGIISLIYGLILASVTLAYAFERDEADYMMSSSNLSALQWAKGASIGLFVSFFLWLVSMFLTQDDHSGTAMTYCLFLLDTIFVLTWTIWGFIILSNGDGMIALLLINLQAASHIRLGVWDWIHREKK